MHAPAYSRVPSGDSTLRPSVVSALPAVAAVFALLAVFTVFALFAVFADGT
jgi:hypothetical protein